MLLSVQIYIYIIHIMNEWFDAECQQFFFISVSISACLWFIFSDYVSKLSHMNCLAKKLKTKKFGVTPTVCVHPGERAPAQIFFFMSFFLPTEFTRNICAYVRTQERLLFLFQKKKKKHSYQKIK